MDELAKQTYRSHALDKTEAEVRIPDGKRTVQLAAGWPGWRGAGAPPARSDRTVRMRRLETLCQQYEIMPVEG